ncbi:MAG: glycoside hydrolase family 2 TIM barrel-domain containing protein [Candidatus Omnitrophota bacterium]
MQKVKFNIFGCCALGALMFFVLSVACVKAACAQETAELQNAPESSEDLSAIVAKSWEALTKNESDKVYAYAKEMVDSYGVQARQQQKSLTAFPAAEKTKNYDILNSVATCLFIKGEALLKEDKTEEAKKVFQLILSDYSYAQAWDPRGWYWKVAEKAQATLDKLEGEDIEKSSTEADKYQGVPRTKIVLYDGGKEDVVDYAKYGDFVGIGTKNYKYIIKSQEGLSEAVGEGIYPNTTSVRWDPAFRQVRKEKRLEGNHWDFVYSPDLEAAFIKWAISPEPQGIKLFYTGLILEKSGLIKHAIKAYYAIVVHFPHTVGWTYWHTPWYVGQAAIARIKYLCTKYPQLNMSLSDTKISVINGFDNDVSNDIFVTNPGRIVKNHIPETLFDRIKKYIDKRVAQTKIKRKLGAGKVRFVQYENGDWQLLVNNRPYVIKGITYAVAKVGQSPDNGSLKGWMEYDYNKNGKCDGPYDSFVDTNGNGTQDRNEPTIGDFELMKRLGVNTVRIYHQPYDIDKKILRDLYKRHGIRVIMGDFLGKYAIGSGATWFDGTDYDNEEQQKTMLESVRKMVNEFKDEPYILTWLLGNENVYGVACNADKKPGSFFKFVNEAARLIKSLDKNHPVAIASGDTLFLDQYAQYCPDVDMFGANVYRGESGFGSYWESVKELTDKPAFVTEYGCPAFAYGLTEQEAEDAQAEYLKGNWENIMDNAAFGPGCGNAIGGVLFEWLDEWWKAYEPSFHDKKGLFKGPFPDGSMHEEWLGVAGQGDGTKSPFLRELRKSYYEYQKLWKK